jgi:hypothetical protein
MFLRSDRNPVRLSRVSFRDDLLVASANHFDFPATAGLPCLARPGSVAETSTSILELCSSCLQRVGTETSRHATPAVTATVKTEAH